jgi:aspartate aminotransferase-like enzyme
MHQPVIGHRSQKFASPTRDLLLKLATVFGTSQGQVFVYPASGIGAWEASLVNALTPGDVVLTFNRRQRDSAAIRQTVPTMELRPAGPRPTFGNS